MDITLTINGLDLSNRLSTYSVTHEITYRKVITTLDNVEHPYPGASKPIVNFTLLPVTEEEDTALYNILSNYIVEVTFSDKGVETTKQMRVVSNLESVFLLKSVDGKRRYKNGAIQLRSL